MTGVRARKETPATRTMQEEKQMTSYESGYPENGSTTIITTVDPEKELTVLSEAGEIATQRRNTWLAELFRYRFNPARFRPGRGIFEQRFSIAEAALLLMMAYLGSRGLGLIRQILFNHLFGAGLEANAYYAAFRLPDALFNLIAGGALIQAFVPVFVLYENAFGRKETWRLASLIFNVVLATLTGLVLVGEFVAPAFVTHWLVPGYSPSEQALTITLTRIMLVQPLLLGIGTIATAMLSSKRQFFLPALSIVIYNVGLIGGLLFSLAIPAIGIFGPAFGALAAAVFQVLVQLPGLIKQKVEYTFIWDLKHPGLRDVLYLLGPNVLTVGLVSIGLIIDTAFTSYLPDKASLSAIHNAHLLFDVAIALLGQAVGQAALPRMSKLAAIGLFVHLRRLILKIICGAVLISIPIAVLLCLFGRPIIHILLQQGAFSRHAASLATLALIGYAVGLPGHLTTELSMRSFYAIKNPLVPLFTNILALPVRIGLVFFLLKTLAGKYVILAIPLAAAGATTIEAGLLFLLLLFYLQKEMTSNKECETKARFKKGQRNLTM